MEHANVEVVLDQLKKALGVTKDKELAAFLGVTGKAISAAKRRGSVPSKWILKVNGQHLSELTTFPEKLRKIEINLPMSSESRIDLLEAERRRLSEEIRQLHAKKVPTAPELAPFADCPHCARLEARLEKLESKLESVEAQRDDLAMENRQLWKENSEYRERLARYEERAVKPHMEDPDPGDRPLA